MLFISYFRIIMFFIFPHYYLITYLIMDDLLLQLQRYDDSAGASAAIQDAMAKLSADDVSFSRGKVLAVAGYVAHSQGNDKAD